MLEALKKVDDLITMLEEKNAKADAANKQIADRKVKQDEVERKQVATANQLAARERLLGKADDSEKAKAEMEEMAKRVAADKVTNNLKAASLKSSQEELDKDKKDLEVMKAVYAKKNANMDAREIEYNTKFKLMREKVLEEIKGKL